MRSHAKTRKLISWLGVVISAMLLGVWALSTRYSYVYVGDDWFVEVWAGRLILEKGVWVTIRKLNRIHYDFCRPPADLIDERIHDAAAAPHSVLAAAGGWGFELPRQNGNAQNWSLIIPVWVPFLLGALPTLALMRAKHHRFRPGMCSCCHYNLTGNTSGICPECGTPCQSATP